MFQQDDQLRSFGVTAVENLFITEYLPHADGDKVRVYLLGLYRSMTGSQDYGIPELAQELGLDLGQVEAALRYWERRRLVERVGDKPPSYVFHHIGHRFLTGQDGFIADKPFVEFSEAVYTQFGDRRKLRPNDIAEAFEWVADFALPQEVILMLLNHFADTRGVNFSFKRARETAALMRDEGISTPEDAEIFFSHSKRSHDGTRAVLRQLGIRRLPSEPELQLYRKWTMDWHFDEDAILAACQQTTAANHPSFAYLDSILERLSRQGGKKSSARVEAQLQAEEATLSQVKEVLDILGIRVSAPAVAPAYQALNQSFAHPLILLAARSVQVGRGLFEDLEPKLMAWQTLGLDSEQKVRAHLNELNAYKPLMSQVFERSGMSGQPRELDLMRAKEWLGKGFSQERILEAAEKARDARQKLAYMHSVLEGKPWNAKSGRKVGFQDYDQGDETRTQEAPGPDLFMEAKKLHDQ